MAIGAAYISNGNLFLRDEAGNPLRQLNLGSVFYDDAGVPTSSTGAYTAPIVTNVQVAVTRSIGLPFE